MDAENILKVDRDGQRLDRFVTENSPELTRTQVQKLIADGFITVNGKAAKPGYKLAEGDEIKVVVPPPPPTPLAPQDIDVKIIYEDADVVVVDKPAGMTVHPAPGNRDGTLVNALLAKYPALGEISDSLRPGIVHRLDKDTSGVMVVAKNKAAQLDLEKQFRERTISKIYLTLVKDKVTPEHGIIEAELGRDPADRKKIAVVDNGREARTEFKVLGYYRDYTLLEIKPETGRTHQIRVHLAAIGHPVAGDAAYGGRASGFSRQFLHAHKLRFRLPSSGEEREFVSELAPDLKKALDSLA